MAIVGHNAMREGRMEIRKPASPFLASVAYFPERYGARLVKLASAMAGGETVPLAVYTDHAVLDQENVDVLYPGERDSGASTDRRSDRTHARKD
ncbi:MAG: hypothetical protein IPJ98_28485 [Bryobacterales bacterium]|nr:hypothetical protein [Bryobacterales bacterium]